MKAKTKTKVRRRAKWGTLDQLLLDEVKTLRLLPDGKQGRGQAVRIDPKAASARSVAGKVSSLRKENHPEFLDVRVTVMGNGKAKAAFLYLGDGAREVVSA